MLVKTWMDVDVKHMVGFCTLRLDMSIIGSLMGDNTCIKVSLQEKTMLLEQFQIKFVSRFLFGGDKQ